MGSGIYIKKLSFRSYSKPLFVSVYKILMNVGLKPRLASGNDLRIDSINDIGAYFRLVGSNNSKHLKRLRK